MNIDDATFVEDLRRPLSKDSWLPAIRFGDGIAELNAIRARAADIIERLTSSPTPSYPGLPDNSEVEYLAETLEEAAVVARNCGDLFQEVFPGVDEDMDKAAAVLRRQASALAGARSAALEEAARICLILERDVCVDVPNGPAWKYYGRSRDDCAKAIRALGTPAEKEK